MWIVRHDLARGLDSIQQRHSYIGNHHVRMMLRYEFDGLPPIFGFRYDFEVRLLFKQQFEPRANQGVIVGENDPDLRHAYFAVPIESSVYPGANPSWLTTPATCGTLLAS